MTAPTHNFNTAANPNRTLKQMRDDLMRRLGFGAQVNNPPPGMVDLLNSFLNEAATLTYQRYAVMRMRRQFSWALVAGQRFYDLTANAEQPDDPAKLDPSRVTGAWLVRDTDGRWCPLTCGIPAAYNGLPNALWPLHYQIRQALEVWPEPSSAAGWVVLEGDVAQADMVADADQPVADAQAVFLLALSNAKAHYGKPDADRYVRMYEAYASNRVAGTHGTRRYLPGGRSDRVAIYTPPAPTEPFA